MRGKAGNRPALGARVIIATPTGKQTAVVGWAEGSHYGAGHYRIYFGLGSSRRIDTLTVIWPDGFRQTLTDVSADQILMLSEEN